MPASGSTATLVGLAGTVFGCQDIATIVLWNLNSRRPGKSVIVSDEQGMEVAFAIHGGRIVDSDGSYLFKGTTIGSGGIGTSLGISDTDMTSGTLYVVEFGLKQQHENFKEGDFKAMALDGA